MKTMYKLTDKDMQTYHGFQWTMNKWEEIPLQDRGCGLCSPGYFHCYSHPLLAIVFNCINMDYDPARLFVVEVVGDEATDSGVKFGYTRMRLVEELPLPAVTTEQRLKFAILCVLAVYKADEKFTEWAKGWLDGTRQGELPIDLVTVPVGIANSDAILAVTEARYATDDDECAANLYAYHTTAYAAFINVMCAADYANRGVSCVADTHAAAAAAYAATSMTFAVSPGPLDLVGLVEQTV